MRLATALLLSVMLAGCPLFPTDDDDSAAVDDDDTAQDDDDAAGGTCSELGAPGTEESVPCDFDDGGDVWTLVVAPGDQVSITVDTLDAPGTFDPRFRLVDGAGAFLTSGDDECDCAFPPPGDYLCAEGDYTADADGLLELHVSSFIQDACVDGILGTYVLRLAVDGDTVTPALATDDGPTLFGG